MCAYAMAKNVQACVLEVKQCILAITLFRYTLFCFEMICQGIVLGLHAKNQLDLRACVRNGEKREHACPRGKTVHCIN